MDQNSTLKLHIPKLLEHIFLLTCITLKIEENQTFYIFDRKIAPKMSDKACPKLAFVVVVRLDDSLSV